MTTRKPSGFPPGLLRTICMAGVFLWAFDGLFGAAPTGSVTVSGTADVGQTLSVSNDLADADGLGVITYQWFRDGLPINMLKDGVGGVDDLNGADDVILSADGNHAYVTGTDDDAVSWYERNSTTGALTYGGMLKDGVGGVDGLDGVSSVTLSADENHAYVTGFNDSAVSWYDRNASTGALTYGGMLKDGVGGVDGLDSASGVTLSADGKHAYVTGYFDDAVSWFERNASTGALTYGGMLKDGVGGVDGLNYALEVTLSADGKHAYVTGYGDDAVSWYDRNASTGALTYGGMLKDEVNGVDGLDSASGLTLSADGKHAYVTGYADSAVGWYERNSTTGTLTYGGMLKDGVGGVDGLDGAQGVTLSPDGKHAYVTGYGDNAVGWYERNVSTGALTYGGMLKDGVNGVDGLGEASGVTLSADGNHTYVTGWSDDAVGWYERNASTGALSFGSPSNSNYTLTAMDTGTVITVVASYTDGLTNFESVSSVATSIVAAAPNSAPVITSYWGGATAAVSVLENQTFAADVNATDADGNATVSYLVGGGADQSKFDLNSTTGILTFKTAPDYENPTDADSNNTYVVQVNATDGNASVSQLLTVTVTDEVETSPVTPCRLRQIISSRRRRWPKLGNCLQPAS